MAEAAGTEADQKLHRFAHGAAQTDVNHELQKQAELVNAGLMSMSGDDVVDAIGSLSDAHEKPDEACEKLMQEAIKRGPKGVKWRKGYDGFIGSGGSTGKPGGSRGTGW